MANITDAAIPNMEGSGPSNIAGAPSGGEAGLAAAVGGLADIASIFARNQYYKGAGSASAATALRKQQSNTLIGGYQTELSKLADAVDSGLSSDVADRKARVLWRKTVRANPAFTQDITAAHNSFLSGSLGKVIDEGSVAEQNQRRKLNQGIDSGWVNPYAESEEQQKQLANMISWENLLAETGAKAQLATDETALITNKTAKTNLEKAELQLKAEQDKSELESRLDTMGSLAVSYFRTQSDAILANPDPEYTVADRVLDIERAYIAQEEVLRSNGSGLSPSFIDNHLARVKNYSDLAVKRAKGEIESDVWKQQLEDYLNRDTLALYASTPAARKLILLNHMDTNGLLGTVEREGLLSEVVPAISDLQFKTIGGVSGLGGEEDPEGGGIQAPKPNPAVPLPDTTSDFSLLDKDRSSASKAVFRWLGFNIDHEYSLNGEDDPVRSQQLLTSVKRVLQGVKANELQGSHHARYENLVTWLGDAKNARYFEKKAPEMRSELADVREILQFEYENTIHPILEGEFNPNFGIRPVFEGGTILFRANQNRPENQMIARKYNNKLAPVMNRWFRAMAHADIAQSEETKVDYRKFWEEQGKPMMFGSLVDMVDNKDVDWSEVQNF